MLCYALGRALIVNEQDKRRASPDEDIINRAWILYDNIKLKWCGRD
jgi:hypothetical protein